PNWPYIAAFSIAMGDSDAASGWMKFSVDMMTMMSRAQQMSKEQTEQLIAATRKSLEGLRGMSFTFGLPQAGRSIYSRMGMIMDVDDSKAYLENYQQTIEKMKEIFADLPNSPYRLMSVEKTTVAGVEGLKMVMQMPLDTL